MRRIKQTRRTKPPKRMNVVRDRRKRNKARPALAPVRVRVPSPAERERYLRKLEWNKMLGIDPPELQARA